MGRKARIRRERAATSPTTAAATPPPSSRPRPQLRKVLLWALPAVSIAVAGALGLGLDSRPAAGIVLLLGAGLWIAVFAGEVSRETPRRDRLRGGGIDFGRSG